MPENFWLIFGLLMFGQLITFYRQWQVIAGDKKKEKQDNILFFIFKRSQAFLFRTFLMFGFAFILAYPLEPQQVSFHADLIVKYKRLVWAGYLIAGFGFDTVLYLIFDGGLSKIKNIVKNFTTKK